MGTRSINNVVDVTNFVLMETGQPMHAFDFDKLAGGKIVVRRAKQDEKIVTIDGVERTLDPSILIIADERKPVAIAGIMGGKDTEVTAMTKKILLESALFDSILIRRASRKLGLSSDSSYRFERGVDVQALEANTNRAATLILDSAGGKMTQRSNVLGVKTKVIHRGAISVSLKQISSCLGGNFTAKQCKNILEKLAFGVAVKKDILTATPSSFRGDIKQDVDLIEEIARIIGYDQLPSSLPLIKVSAQKSSPKREVHRKIRETLVASGFSEVITYAMIDQRSIDRTRLQDQIGTKIQNPLSQEQEMMRPVILPSLLKVVQTNFNRGQKDIKIFEIGKIYRGGKEREVLACLATGIHAHDWRRGKQEIDFFDLKGSVEKVFEGIRVPQVKFVAASNVIFDDGQAADIVKDHKIGFAGKISDEILENWEIKQKNIFFAWVKLDEVFKSQETIKKFNPIVEYPAIVRDVSLAVPENVSFAQIKDLVFVHGKEILASIKFSEQYLGEKIATGYRGLVFSLVYQSSAKTLREEDVGSIHNRIIEALVKELGVIKR